MAAFILPLQLRRRFGIRVLEWLGSPQSTYGHGLFAHAFLPHARDWLAENWRWIVTLAGPCDAVVLTDMPDAVDGIPHPFKALFNISAANRSYRMKLTADFSQLLSGKRSRESRRQDRRKLEALAAVGEVTFGLPDGLTQAQATLAVMFEQQERRLAEHGIRGVFGADERRFVQRMAELQDEQRPVLLAYTLRCGGDILAVMLGARHGATFYGLISSMTDSGLRQYSPGDLALRRTIESACQAGFAQLDFATGDSCYKLSWADEVIQLRALFGARNLRGLALVMALLGVTGIKRTIKRSAASRRLFAALRRAVLGRPTTGAIRRLPSSG